jgi:hypothetical protein
MRISRVVGPAELMAHEAAVLAKGKRSEVQPDPQGKDLSHAE